MKIRGDTFLFEAATQQSPWKRMWLKIGEYKRHWEPFLIHYLLTLRQPSYLFTLNAYHRPKQKNLPSRDAKSNIHRIGLSFSLSSHLIWFSLYFSDPSNYSTFSRFSQNSKWLFDFYCQSLSSEYVRFQNESLDSSVFLKYIIFLFSQVMKKDVLSPLRSVKRRW